MARAVALLAALVLVLVAAGGAASAQCDATKLAVCAPAIIGGSAPTEPCCSALRAQEGCFCQYARDPAYSGYINSPNSRRALAACSIPVPHC